MQNSEQNTNENQAPNMEEYVEGKFLYPKKKTFRLVNKRIFLTYPQCSLTPKDFTEKMLSFFNKKKCTITKYIVCSEFHNDTEGKHIHALLEFEKAWDVKDPNALDEIAGQHGNYGGVRSWNHAVRYVSKDNDFVFGGKEIWSPVACVNAIATKKGSVFETMAIQIKEGKTLKQLTGEAPGFVLQHGKKINEFIALLETFRDQEKKPELPWLGLKEVFRPFYVRQVVDWCNKNLCKPRTHKQAQLWICGPPNAGKTHFILELQRRLKSWQIVCDDRFTDGWSNDVYDFAYLDEFSGQKPIWWLNQWLEGTQMCLYRKGLPPMVKTQNVPTIILSNMTPAEIYSREGRVLKEAQLEALMERIELVEIPPDYRLTCEFNEPEVPQLEELPPIIERALDEHTLQEELKVTDEDRELAEDLIGLDREDDRHRLSRQPTLTRSRIQQINQRCAEELASSESEEIDNYVDSNSYSYSDDSDGHDSIESDDSSQSKEPPQKRKK